MDSAKLNPASYGNMAAQASQASAPSMSAFMEGLENGLGVKFRQVECGGTRNDNDCLLYSVGHLLGQREVNTGEMRSILHGQIEGDRRERCIDLINEIATKACIFAEEEEHTIPKDVVDQIYGYNFTTIWDAVDMIKGALLPHLREVGWSKKKIDTFLGRISSDVRIIGLLKDICSLQEKYAQTEKNQIIPGTIVEQVAEAIHRDIVVLVEWLEKKKGGRAVFFPGEERAPQAHFKTVTEMLNHPRACKACKAGSVLYVKEGESDSGHCTRCEVEVQAVTA